MDFSTTHLENEELASWEISLVRELARHFHLAYRFTPAIDEDDLAQECLTHWWQQRHRYSAERGASQKTYMRAVLQKKLLDIARREGAEKRRSQTEAVSLNREINDEEENGDELGDLIADEYPAWDPETAAGHSELRRRIENALALLSSRQRQLAQARGSENSMAEISRALNIPRPTLYDELKRIKKVFRDEGLEEFIR